MSKSDVSLAADLARVARDLRAELAEIGERPTAEDLAAFREGKLGPAAAEQVRDWVAVDPGVAAEVLSESELDARWRAFLERIRREAMVDSKD